MIALLLAAATAGAAMPRAADPPAAGMVPYRVRKGDTLALIARSYLRSMGDYVEVQRVNRIADPLHLRPGAVLLIPSPLLRAVPIQARIVAFRGVVTLDRARAARIGATLREGTRVATGVNASVSFTLADRSKITLPSLSVIRIVRLRRILLSGQVERAFLLEAGRSEAEVTPSRHGRDPFEIRTPISVAAVRGTQFRVTVEPGGQTATTSVVEGKVSVDGKGGEALVPAEYGLKSDAQSTGSPAPLLPPPDFDPPVHIEADGTQVFRLTPSVGAARYRLQIANDAEFEDIRSEVTQAAPVFELPPAPEGTYAVRATAIDDKDVEGLPSTIYRYTYRHVAGTKTPDAAAQAAPVRPTEVSGGR